MFLESQVKYNNLIIFFSRPEKLNAINSAMWRDLGKILEEYCFSTSIKSIIITGKGRFFSSGDDISEMYELKSIGESDTFFELIKKTLVNMSTCMKPLIAALNGPAAGGGAEILFFFDHVVAVRDAWISFPETNIRLIPPVFNVISPYVLGLKRAVNIGLSGEKIPVTDALKIGIVDEIVDKREILLEKAVSSAKKFIKKELPFGYRAYFINQYIEQIFSNINVLKTLVLTKDSKKLMKEFLGKK